MPSESLPAKLRELADRSEPLSLHAGEIRQALRAAANQIEALEADNAAQRGTINTVGALSDAILARHAQELAEKDKEIAKQHEVIRQLTDSIHGEAYLEAERDRAVEAVRKRAIHHHMDAPGYFCGECNGDWLDGTPERHLHVTLNGVEGPCPCERKGT